jgi:hypothetical protein
MIMMLIRVRDRMKALAFDLGFKAYSHASSLVDSRRVLVRKSVVVACLFCVE